jgi:hypothetical protein
MKRFLNLQFFADEVADIFKLLAVIVLTVHLTVGAERSMASRLTVAEAVIVPIDVPA